MTKTLYEVNVEFTYYALAESRGDAESLVSDAFQDEDRFGIADAHPVTSTARPDWPGDCLV